jgi:CHAT domain-containing protein/Tfp pilus assembly protein PilF
MKIALTLLMLFLPFCGWSQVVDTAAVMRVVDSLIQVSRGLTNNRDFEKAMEVTLLAERLVLEKIGTETPAYGNVCFNRGRVLDYKGEYSESEKWYLLSLELREKILGKEHPDYAASLNNLAYIYMATEKYDKAESLYLAAIAIKRKVLGNEHIDYARSVNNLGNLYRDIGKFEKSEELLLESMNIFRIKLGEEIPEYGNSVNNLGVLYYKMGNFEKAEKYYINAINIRKKVFGEDHPEYAASLMNLAILYMDMDLFEASEQLCIKAKNIRAITLGKYHPDYAWSLIGLGGVNYKMFNYEKAEQYYIESRDIFEKTLGKNNLAYALALNNLGALYTDMEDFSKSESFFIEASNIRKLILGIEHPDYARSIESLAILYSVKGSYEKAEPIYLEAKNIFSKAVGDGHSDYIQLIMNLASMYFDKSDYIKSEPLYQNAISSYRQSHNENNINYVIALRGISNLYWSINKKEYAIPHLLESANIEKNMIIKASSHLSELELSKYVNSYIKGINQDLSFAEKQPKLFSMCYDNTLFYKGFLLYSVSKLRKLVLTDSTNRDNYNLLKSYRRRLAAEYSAPIAERDSLNIADLEEKANTVEKELTRTVAGYGAALQQVNWQELQTTLKHGDAAIEFVHYKFKKPHNTDSIMYAALLLRPGDTQPQFIPLFEEKELTPLLRGATGGNNFMKINALYSIPSLTGKQKSLYDLIWKPLESLLKDTKTVYCAPSGLLHRLNLAAIPNSGGLPFGDMHQLVIMCSTRQLVVPNTAPTNNSNNAYLAGGIRYDTDSTALAYVNRGATNRAIESDAWLFHPDSSSISRGGVLDYLPATASEVREIAQTLSNNGIIAQIDTGFYATEESFRKLGAEGPAPRIIHLATHGYFFPDPEHKTSKMNSNFGQDPVFKMSEHPMIRSGLIMAGAKQAWLTGKHPDGLEDGILTAYEISQMNLSGTELVVLSACETGLGDIVGNEGVFGLQRAFKIAGVKYLIMSLWKVDDRSTQEFMTTFYRHWLTDKLEIPEAFHATQHEMRTKFQGAYDWAGFVLIE